MCRDFRAAFETPIKELSGLNDCLELAKMPNHEVLTAPKTTIAVKDQAGVPSYFFIVPKPEYTGPT